LRKLIVLWDKSDPASVNIAEKLTEGATKTDEQELEFHRVEFWERDGIKFAMAASLGELIEEDEASEFADHGFDAVVFASRHESRSREPTLTVHVPGNPTPEAKFGGDPMSLCTADPAGMKEALLTLKKAVDEGRVQGYTVCYEATHHGPSDPGIPCFFIEIGSDEERWKDDDAGRACAEAILAAVDPDGYRHAIGYGGGHYAPKHTDVALTTDIAYGHIIPDYAIDTDRLRTQFKEALEKTPDARHLVIDDSSLPDRTVELLEDLARENNLKVATADELKG